MFDKKRYITVGIHRNIPPPIQEFLWELIDRMTVEKDYDCINRGETVLIRFVWKDLNSDPTAYIIARL